MVLRAEANDDGGDSANNHDASRLFASAIISIMKGNIWTCPI